jgi:dTDP-4-amino-4,6-dideoxygalactose transaminase
VDPTEKNIQLFVPTYDVDACLQEIRECLEVGWTGLGFKTNQFEDAWKAYTGLPHAHFLSSNTVGLHLALAIYKQELGWSDGDEVISTPLTFVSTNHAILYERLKPVFADTDDTLCLDPASIERAIGPRTRAVLYVGMGGNAGQLGAVAELCKQRGLKLILDAAHMSGTRYRGVHVGGEADCTVFSYQAVKNLPTADSGMICFRDAALDAQARKWSWLGISKDTYARAGAAGSKGNYKWMYDVEHVGFKAHGNSVVAAIALVQLKTLDADNDKRRALCAQYQDLFAGTQAVKQIPHLDDCVSSRHLFQVRVENRDQLIEHLNAHKIFPGVHYRANTEYRMYRDGLGKCPRAEAASRELISLPLHLRLTADDVRRVASAVKSFFVG